MLNITGKNIIFAVSGLLISFLDAIIINFSALHYQKVNLIAMKTGTVKFFNESKGFGFIVDDETQAEVFVHISGLIDKINQGDQVTYSVTEGRKGPNAIDVKLA